MKNWIKGLSGFGLLGILFNYNWVTSEQLVALIISIILCSIYPIVGIIEFVQKKN